MLKLKEPIFILSAQRSGSTLLRIMLDRIPGIVGLPETSFWSFKKSHGKLDPADPSQRADIARRWVQYFTVKKWDVDHAKLEEELIEKADTWAKVFELTVARYVEDAGIAWFEESVICEKTPAHIHKQLSILEDYPDARFIYLVRDPRDQAASLKKCPWSTSNMYVIARVWRSGIRSIGTNPNSITIRYEDLVRETEATFYRLTDFLRKEVAYEDVKDPDSRQRVGLGHQKVERHGKALQAVSDKSISKWRQGLSRPDKDLQVIQYVCEKEMTQFGYALEPYEKSIAVHARICYGRLGLLLSKISL
ncbi:MAG TPA: sulfotransferase [Rhodothermales bacterium]|nr:sulfotransferase [Rhodothermales bacterium]